MSKRLTLAVICICAVQCCFGQQTKLIIRVDDMGMSRATNAACIKSFTEGIAASVEVMVPTPWFLEAVSMLARHPDFDAGIHLVLTSEWSNLKWRPLTHAPSLVDSNGYFYPTIWKGSPDFPSLHAHQPNFAEAEQELRRQIETARRHISRLSHISTHMGFEHSHPALKEIVERLRQEYHLPISKGSEEIDFPAPEEIGSDQPKERIKAFIRTLSRLEKGKTYLFVCHPAFDADEMESINTPTYPNVRKDRFADFSLLTSKRVRRALKQNDIQLVSVKAAL
jgi:predicted glycoside hydrolase/deacetylase ChbG (UPF0249 family)